MSEGRAPRVTVTVTPGTRLEELMARYAALKAEAEGAAGRLKDLTDAIKAEATGAYPGVTALTLSGGPGLPSLALTWVESWRVDAKALKEADPRTYVTYAVKSGRWELRSL